MNKKKITAIIIACVVIVGGIAVGLNKFKDTKAVQNTQEKVEENKENQKPSKQTQKIYKNDITVYKGDAKVDYIKEKTTIHVNNEKMLEATHKEGFVTEIIISPDKEIISSKENMDLNVQFLTAKNQKVFKNMYAFKQKKGDKYRYIFINYKRPFTITNNEIDPNIKLSMTYAKVVSADENGIKLDNGQYFNIKKDNISLSFENPVELYEGATDYSPKHYPKNTLIKISKENDKIKDIQKIVVLF
ncbi:transcriptional regulator [Clostridium botulinum]|uniref:Transcriptional regulator n=1 Tax=Clostridium botulinum TaxID=1491 RepID=A0A6M0T1M6_CLOBO|nr:transcriptional regulator [Clostridium botulinum]NFI74353.1 transcriptional regulator [Clostridium sporogenes]NFP62261.1 transcriptional regulator [Clostridium sporogenes]NFU95587.1 transcriptional regulator [Clostridium sporogenes]NFV67920.1 transcriptional regulator [Clostridium botulinum]